MKSLGEFNHSVLRVRGPHREHWLNGAKTVEYQTALSRAVGSPILLLHHGTDIWLRIIRIRRLD